MKEIREIKMVEQVSVKFVADDGKEFVGEHAERDCRDYERTKDEKRVEQAFKRLDVVELNMPFVSWFNDEQGFYKIRLESHSDFIAMMDYFNVVWKVYENYIDEPSHYPYTMIVSESYDCVNEYGNNLEYDLKKALEQVAENKEDTNE